MARADLLLNLARAGAKGDQRLLRESLQALVAEERAKQHHILADRLAAVLAENGNSPGIPVADDRVTGLFYEVAPRITLDDLVLSRSVRSACCELVEEHNRRDLLRSHGIEPRSRVLLVGPPGNGKTSLAEALAAGLMLPMLVIRYEGVIGSYLGETAVRLRRLLEYVATRHCLLFLDEFDTLGKERGDVHDTGEIKRVVSSLLLQLDALPSHVVVVTATNHPELLDRAVWRRFQLRLNLPQPGVNEIKSVLERFEQHIGEPFGIAPETLARKLNGLAFSEVADFCSDVYRRYILASPGGSLRALVTSRLDQIASRASQPASD